MRPILVTHCGAGSTHAVDDAAQGALAAGMKVLGRGGSALRAVEEAVVILEDDPRTNAGTGSVMRVDGTIQMDASIMDSRLRVGAVAAISDVRNPIRVARRVMDTPHILLVGSWATDFARKCGFPPYDTATDHARARRAEVLRNLRAGKVPPWARRWLGREHDTVGAVARDAKGRFAAANSTGGISLMLAGRAGDSPVVGAGLYAGPAGAVATTGVGEEIMRRVLAKFVYDRIARNGPQGACEAGIKQFPKSVPIGIIAVGRGGAGEASNRDMAWAANVAPRARPRRV